MVEYLPRNFYNVNRGIVLDIDWIEFNLLDTFAYPNITELDTKHYIYKIDDELFIDNFGERFYKLINQQCMLKVLAS